MKKNKFLLAMFLICAALAFGTDYIIPGVYHPWFVASGPENIYIGRDTGSQHIHYTGPDVDLFLKNVYPEIRIIDYKFTLKDITNVEHVVEAGKSLPLATRFFGTAGDMYYLIVSLWYTDPSYAGSDYSVADCFSHYFFKDEIPPVISSGHFTDGTLAIIPHEKLISFEAVDYAPVIYENPEHILRAFGSGINADSWQYSYDNVNWSVPGRNLFYVNRPEGIHTLYVRVKDNIGNIGTMSGTVIVDGTPPDITVTGDMGTSWSQSASHTVHAEAVDLLSGVQWIQTSNNENQGWRNIEDKQYADITFYDEGSHKAGFRAMDMTGNYQAVYATVNLDRTPPVISAAVDGIVSYNGTRWTIPVRIYDITEQHSGISSQGWRYKIDGGDFASFYPSSNGNEYTGNISANSLTGGAHRLSILVTDNAKNSQTVSVDFIVDADNPVINYASQFGSEPENARWTNGEGFAVNVTDSGSGVSAVTAVIKRQESGNTWTVTGDAIFNGNAIVFSSGTADGLFQIDLRAKDNAGNITTLTLYAWVDRRAPVITIPEGISGTGSVSAGAQDTMSGVDHSTWEWRSEGGVWKSGNTALVPDGKNRRVTFRVKDNVGNLAEKNGEFIVDTKPPEVSATVPAFAFQDNLNLKFFITDEITDIEQVWYEIDGKHLTPVNGWPNPEVVINTMDLTEGDHTITVIAKDKAGHTGRSLCYTYNIDRTAPEITSVEIRDSLNSEKTLSDFDFTAVPKVLLTVFGTDQDSGVITYRYWNVQIDEDASPEFSESRRTKEDQFAVEELADGVNYVFFCMEDAGGNRSEVIKRIVTVDRTIPGPPVIRSTTHPTAKRVEQASPLAYAEFRLTPAYYIRSGITGYRWQLSKFVMRSGIESDTQVILEGLVNDPDEEGGGILVLNPGDNNEQEFYRLSVQCISGNGLTGVNADYQFRIDSVPPNDLRILISPQMNEDEWYSDSGALVMWNQPADMTGVREYRYWITSDEDCVFPNAAELAEYDLSEWGKAANTELHINVKTVLAGKPAGRIRIGICAIDYAGNRKLGIAQLQSDLLPPVFGKTTGKLRITGGDGEVGFAKELSWDELSDEESGAGYITVIVSGSGLSRSFTLPPDSKGFIADRLEDNTVYVFMVRGYDRAGNKTEIFAVDVTGDGEIPQEFSLPYSERIDGYELTGQRIMGREQISYTDLSLQIPATAIIYKIQEIDGVLTREPIRLVPLTQVEIKDDLPQTAMSAAGRFEAMADGFRIEGKRIAFERGSGTAIEDVQYTRPVVVKDLKHEMTVELGRTSLGLPPVIRFSSGQGLLDDPVIIETISETKEKNGGTTTIVPGFSLIGVESLRLQTGGEWFSGNGISLDTTALFDRHGISFTTHEKNRKIPIRDARAEAESRNLRGEFAAETDKPLTLTLSNTVYAVKEAGVRGQFIDIYEAVLALPEECEPRELILRNFILDSQNGQVSKGPDFYTDSLKITSPNGGVFESDNIDFDTDGRLVATGALTSEIYGVIPIDWLLINNNGADWEEGGRITAFTMFVHGFSVSINAARFTGSGIYIDNGTIDLYGLPRNIAGLGLSNKRKDDVYASGTILDNFTDDAGYSAPLTFNGGNITASGVFSTVTVPLAPGITSGDFETSWIFEQAKLDPLGGISAVASGSHTLIIADHILETTEIEFTGKELCIGKLVSELIPGLDTGSAEFKNMRLNGTGILQAARAVVPSVFLAGGWRVAYDALKLDERGIGGDGTVELPAKLGGLIMNFTDTLIGNDGSFISGKAGENLNKILIQGVPVILKEAELISVNSAYILSCDSPVLSLGSVGGPDLFLGLTQFDFLGTVIENISALEPVKFTAANGYRIDVGSCRIDSDGIWFDGSIAAKWWDIGQSIDAAGKGIRLLSGFNVTAKGSLDDAVRIQFADFFITARDVSFEGSKIRIGTGIIEYRDMEFNLGEIQFSPEGLLFESVNVEQNIDIPLVNGLIVRLKDLMFNNIGLDANLLVMLPEYLGGHSLAFDNVGFNADGGFRLRTGIEYFRFDLGGFEFEFEGIAFDSSGLNIRETIIVLPSALDNAEILLYGLRINGSGVNIENYSHTPIYTPFNTPVSFWNMEWHLYGFSINDGVMSFSGEFNLPKSMPGSLSGCGILIQEFRLDLSGNVLSFIADLDASFTVSFLGVWSLTLNTLSIRYIDKQPWIFIKNSALQFPDGFIAQDVWLDEIAFNPLTGDFDFETIEIDSEINMNFLGLEFLLNGLRVGQDHRVSFIGSVRLPKIGVPEFLAGKTMDLETFEIMKDGTLGAVSAVLEDINGKFFSHTQGITLYNGYASLIRTGERAMLISVGGDIMLSLNMPGPLAGKVLGIETFTIDTSPAIPEIVKLKAGVDIPSMMLFDVQFSNIHAGIEWDRTKKDGWLELSGAMILPGTFPTFLAGQAIDVSDFVISLSGKPESFSASFSTEPGVFYDALGYIQMSDVRIGIGLENGIFVFDGAGTILLPRSRFPEGIGGVIAPVSMRMNSQSGLTALSADALIPGGKLFGALSIQGGTIGIHKNEGSPAVISIGGRLLLPDNFPQGLRGVSVTIWSFIINTEGKIIDLDISASGIEGKLFGVAELLNGRIAFETGSDDEFIVDVAGRVKLSSRLPDGLSGKELSINTLALSTRTGLISCEVGLNSKISFTLPGQIKIDVNSLFLNETAVTVSATASLPSYYPPGLANTRIDLRVLTIDWNGRLLDIQGGLGTMDLELAGFSAIIESLYFEKDSLGRFWIVLGSCRLRFPAFMGTLGGQYIGVKNARFNLDTGAFMGDIELPRLQTEIAGFRLVLDEPVLEFTDRRIKFTKVTLHTPDFMGSASISLNGLKISAGAIEGSGAGFKLPNFSIGGLQFSNVAADFIISNSQYIISGQGSVLIPGAGQIYARLAFATRSETYPIGLKQAEFSYQVGFGGIPLGSTGLYLSGISGGIAYGPPNDLPQKVQGLFQPKGPRIKLGLYVTDYSGGKFIEMNPETWVDIVNPAWAFSGNASVLKGTLNINSHLLAAVSGAGFYGGMDIELSFVRGSVEIYIFDKQGKVVFSGEGHVKFGLKKGAILKQDFLFLTVYVPPSDIWLAKIGAEFGLFTNGKTGFKGYVELPILGTVGVFVAPGTFIMGGVSSYTIEKPNWANVRFANISRFSMNNPGIIFGNTTDMVGAADDGGISSFYTVLIPKKPDSSKNENGLERIVFLLSHIEGEPGISVTAPSGNEYREGDDHTETVYMENITAFIVHSSEAGIWQIKVSGIEEDLYALSVLGSEAVPSITVTEPVSGTFSETITVKGTTDAFSSKIRIRAQENREKPAFDLGSYEVNKDGTFTAEVSIEMIPDGEYLIAVDLVTEEDEVSPVAYAPGKIRIDRSALPLYEPEPVRIAETDSGTVTLRWQNNNGMRTSGYLVKMKNITNGTESVFNTGNITSITMPGFSDGEELSFEVATVDTRNRESSYSSPITIKIGGKKPEVNRPVVRERVFQLEAAAGGYTEGSIYVSIAEYQDTSDASGYILARLTDSGDNGNMPAGRLIFEGPVKIERETAEISWYLHVSETQSPGIVRYSAEIINEANSSLRSPFTLEITIFRPQPEIWGIEPDEFDGSAEQTLTIYGTGFVPGTAVWYRGNELSLTGRKNDFSATRIEAILPAQTEAGEYPVTVLGPDGKSAGYPVRVYLPDWYGTLHTRLVETVPGGNADYWISVKGVNGFEGAARFTLIEKPDELEVFLPEIFEGNTGAIQIRVNGNTRPGIYRTNISGGIGKTFELVTVVGDKPLPHLTDFSPSAVYSGTEVHVYGYGLGSGGELRLNGHVVPFSRWMESRIVFTVPDDAASGTLQVVTENAASNTLSFTIRNRGFSLKPASGRIDLTTGETRTAEIFLTGYADIVNLRVEIEAGAPVTVTLDKNAVIPNAAVHVTVNAGINAGNGTWKMRIVGTSRDYEAYAEFTVCIGDVFTINAVELPEAIAGASYYAKITSQNIRGKVTYRLIKGELPAGLDLSLSGEIQGRPQKTGLYRIEIEGQDETANLLGNNGEPLIHISSGSFVITVREEIWGQTGKDGGTTRAVNTDLPADNETAFTYRLNERVDYLLAAEEQVIIVSESGITAIHSATGKLSWTAKGPYREVRYAGDRIYALTGDDILEARDLSIGTLLYTREGIISFSTDDVTILAESGSVRLVLDAVHGTLKERIPKRTESDTSTPEKILWKNGTAFIIGENRIAPVYGTAPAWQTGETILTTAMDSQGASVLTENTLFILDQDFRELVRVTRTSFAETQLALSGDAVLTADRNGIYEYDRKTGDLRWRHNNSYTAERDSIAVGKDKAVMAGDSGLVVLNRTSGELIWGDDKPYRTIALYRERIYAADAEGFVYAYSGPSNRNAPETVIQIWPESPDGTNGWYKTAPTVKVISKDRETFIAETKLFIDGTEIAEPDDFMTLEDGEHQIIAYSTDSQGLQSNTVRVHIKVDTVPPISDYTLPAEDPVNTWYTASVPVTLEGWDESADIPPGSGMDRILTSLGTYMGKTMFSQSGIYDFSWQAVDRAGNREGLRHLEIKIDIEPPVVEGKVFYDQGITEAVISATDLLSGVGVIEYTVNNGGMETYHEPLTFTEEGLYQLKYRAADKAGNYSEWRGLDVWVSPGMQEAALIESATINRKERLVVANIRNGLPLVRPRDDKGKPGFDRTKPEALLNLPRYVLGGEYLFWEQEDILPVEIQGNEPGSIRFRLSVDTVVYLFLPHGMEAPSGFSFVEGNRMINRAYFPAGTQVYMKRFTAGSHVELSVAALTKPGAFPPLIVAQELGSVFAEITVRKAVQTTETTGDTVFEAGSILIPEAVISPWQYTRRLPLRERWAVNTGEDWVPLEENRFEVNGDTEAGFLRFRLELYTPDGQVEYKTEKTIGIVKP